MEVRGVEARGGALQWAPNYRTGVPSPPGSKGSGRVQGAGRGCSGNEVMMAVNSKVSCLVEHHGAASGLCERRLMMCDTG